MADKTKPNVRDEILAEAHMEEEMDTSEDMSGVVAERGTEEDWRYAMLSSNNSIGDIALALLPLEAVADPQKEPEKCTMVFKGFTTYSKAENTRGRITMAVNALRQAFPDRWGLPVDPNSGKRQYARSWSYAVRKRQDGKYDGIFIRRK